MKTATLPSLRVLPQLRADAESVLTEGESLSSFIETAVRETIERRRTRAEFYARGLASSENAKRTGVTIPADVVFAEARARIEAKRLEFLAAEKTTQPKPKKQVA